MNRARYPRFTILERERPHRFIKGRYLFSGCIFREGNRAARYLQQLCWRLSASLTVRADEPRTKRRFFNRSISIFTAGCC